MKEIKQIIGQVIEKTNDSLKIKRDNKSIWIKFFDSDLIKDVQTSETYEIEFQDNIKNNKTYHNGKSIKLAYDTKPAYVEDDISADNQVNSNKLNKVISDSTVNTLIMTVKEIYISNSTPLTMEEIAENVMKAYDKIIEKL